MQAPGRYTAYDKCIPVTLSISNQETPVLTAADGSTVRVDAGTGAFTIPEGGITIKGLAGGDYVLSEFEPPAGYIKTIADVAFRIDGAGDVSDEAKPLNRDKVAFDENATAYTIQNEPGAALPNAGGVGTLPVYALGVLLTAAGMAGLARRLRV